MNTACKRTLFAVVLIAAAFWKASAQISDITPPKLVGLEISPLLVDTSTNAQIVNLTAHITDDLSGFGSGGPIMRSSASIIFRAPGGEDSAPIITAQFIPFLISGTKFDGTYSSQLWVPAHSRTGTWSVVNVQLVDEARNSTNLVASDLLSLGLPISFQVTGVEDRTPPDIISMSLSPASVDISDSNQNVVVTMHLTEDVTWARGIDEFGTPMPSPGTITFISPSKRQFAGSAIFGEQVSGNDRDGVFRTEVQVKRFSEPGIWRLDKIKLTDTAGNLRTIDAGEAAARGFEAEFLVQGAGDTNAPVLHYFDIFPRRISAPTTNQTVTVTAQYSDDLSGFGYVDNRGIAFPTPLLVQFLSPSRIQSVTALVSPDGTDSDWPQVHASGTLDFPRYCETGLWTLYGFSLRDAVGNFNPYDFTAIQALGFPTQIAVGITPSLSVAQQGESIFISWPRWGSDFFLETRAIDGNDGWKAVEQHQSILGDQIVALIPAANVSHIFRLRTF